MEEEEEGNNADRSYYHSDEETTNDLVEVLDETHKLLTATCTYQMKHENMLGADTRSPR